MQIAVKGRGIHVGDQLRERIEKRFEKVGKQVSSFATLEIELRRERNPAIPEPEVAEATLHLKGVTLRARERSAGSTLAFIAPAARMMITGKSTATFRIMGTSRNHDGCQSVSVSCSPGASARVRAQMS